MTYTLEDYLVGLHSGQWFGFFTGSPLTEEDKIYANLVIHSDDTKPTEQECIDGVAALQAEYDATQYQRDRQARYNAELPMGDQFDAILKGFNQLRFDGQDLPADLDEVIGIWLGIKSAIPKE